MTQSVSTQPTGAGRLPLYCDAECQQAAVTRQRSLRRLLVQIEKELTAPNRSASHEQLLAWRRMAAWELSYFPQASVDLALP